MENQNRGMGSSWRFVNGQVKGSYRLWIHEHTFTEKDGGWTLVRDRVDADMRWGSIVHRLFVRRDLEAIFGYRQRILSNLFKIGPFP